MTPVVVMTRLKLPLKRWFVGCWFHRCTLEWSVGHLVYKMHEEMCVEVLAGMNVRCTRLAASIPDCGVRQFCSTMSI